LFNARETYQFQSCVFYGFSSSYMFEMTFRSTSCSIYMTNCVIHNNTVASLSTTIFRGYSTVLIDIKNSIAYNPYVDVAHLIASTSLFNFSFNCQYGPYDLNIRGTNGINADPLFIDPDNNNYNLSPSSPCIDAGTLI